MDGSRVMELNEFNSLKYRLATKDQDNLLLVFQTQIDLVRTVF